MQSILALFLISMAVADTNMPLTAPAAEERDSIAAIRPYTAKFIDEMTSHHKQGAMMARLVEARAQHPELKAMARMMVQDQEREIREMQAIRERAFPRLWQPVDRGAGMNMGKLANQRGLAFDLAFLDSMIAHHPAAVYLGQEAWRRSGHAAIRRLGRLIAAKQARELEQMRAWRDRWSAR